MRASHDHARAAVGSQAVERDLFLTAQRTTAQQLVVAARVLAVVEDDDNFAAVAAGDESRMRQAMTMETRIPHRATAAKGIPLLLLLAVVHHNDVGVAEEWVAHRDRLPHLSLPSSSGQQSEEKRSASVAGETMRAGVGVVGVRSVQLTPRLLGAIAFSCSSSSTSHFSGSSGIGAVSTVGGDDGDGGMTMHRPRCSSTPTSRHHCCCL